MRREKELALFVFIDALGWETFSRHSFLEDVWAKASPLETVLGYSCTCDPTILTGCMPNEHGHFSFFLQDRSGRSPLRHLRWLNLLPSSWVDRGRVRRWLSRAVASGYGFDGYFQLYETPFDVLHHFDYSEKRDIYQPGGILGGQPTIFDRLREEGIPFAISDWRRSESENLHRLQQDIQDGEIAFAYLYLAGLDGILHREGTQSERVSTHLNWYEQELRQLLATADRRYESVRLHLFSDHGMTDVQEHLDLMKVLSHAGLSFGSDYVAYYDSTMARFWFQHAAAENAIRRQLAEVDRGHVLSDEELEQNGVLFPDRRYGELIFLCDPGVLLCPSFMGRKPLAGMHGYDPRHKDSTATFATNSLGGPHPRRLDDLYDLMSWEADRFLGRHDPHRDSTRRVTPSSPKPSFDGRERQPVGGSALADSHYGNTVECPT